jgi:hypothetical protein
MYLSHDQFKIATARKFFVEEIYYEEGLKWRFLMGFL